MGTPVCLDCSRRNKLSISFVLGGAIFHNSPNESRCTYIRHSVLSLCLEILMYLRLDFSVRVDRLVVPDSFHERQICLDLTFRSERGVVETFRLTTGMGQLGRNR